MIGPEKFRRLAGALPEVEESDHWGKPSFRVKGKIFATLHVADRRAVLKLAEAERTMRCELQPEIFSPVKAWAHQGWTWVDLTRIQGADLEAALQLAWRAVAPKRLAETLRPAGGARPARPVRASRQKKDC